MIQKKRRIKKREIDISFFIFYLFSLILSLDQLLEILLLLFPNGRVDVYVEWVRGLGVRIRRNERIETKVEARRETKEIVGVEENAHYSLPSQLDIDKP